MTRFVVSASVCFQEAVYASISKFVLLQHVKRLLWLHPLHDGQM